jgi:hypothetical protein
MRATIEPVAIYKCKGCPPQNQCTPLRFIIRMFPCPPGSRRGERYPFTLTRENDNMARPVVGRPIESAGRKVVKVVKMSMFFFT